MTRVYRVLRRKYASTAFDGEGAYRYGGRWSSGVRLSYTSEHQSLALLEYFVHLDKDDPPKDLVPIAEVPDDLGRDEGQLSQLPSNWRDAAAPPELTGFGDEFVKRGEQCMLVVPSALAPHEHNWLLNPEHQDLKRSVIRELEPLAYDPRLFAKPPRRSRR